MNLVFLFFHLLVWVLSLVASGVACYFTRKWAWAFRFPAAVAVFVATLFFLANFVFGTGEVTDPTELRAAWRSEFGTEPPPEVRDLRAGWHDVSDAGSRWQKFSAPQAVFDGLIHKFIPTSRDEFYRIATNPNNPSWWRPEKETAAAMVYYINTRRNPKSSSSEAVLAYEPTSQTVYFMSSTID
ncbi:hypothetical protein [Roseimicrobium sp. ORNL1]|uniref:hypothetical protein n=1 Tax=Roseimicrobium sp. ORNL1 TaxID=2711231 RepID=UPI0013E141A4|nr:hypothetical protein [Roseimicrobium sp. ORNL1]QIF04932.1 hypothetical protein G5S37_26590 [Roseimicrobium sp. ORNL1]